MHKSSYRLAAWGPPWGAGVHWVVASAAVNNIADAVLSHLSLLCDVPTVWW